MLGIQCDQEEGGNLKTAAHVLLLGDNLQADAINGYLQQRFYRIVNSVKIV